jgi:hypothetical protein
MLEGSPMWQSLLTIVAKLGRRLHDTQVDESRGGDTRQALREQLFPVLCRAQG